MKKVYLIIILILSNSFFIYSQDTIKEIKDIKLESLKSPTNPAFIMMNTSPTEIVEPGSAPEFYTSLQNASDNFSAIPNNFGFSVTPFWWTKNAKKLDFDKDFNTNKQFTFFRTLSVSGGVVQGIENNDQLRRYGIGFQSTLLRGQIEKAKKDAYFNKLKDYHDGYNELIISNYKKNKEYNALDSLIRQKRIEIQTFDIFIQSDSCRNKKECETKIQMLISFVNQLEDTRTELRSELDNSIKEEVKTLESNSQLDKEFNEMNQRIGLKWDIGGGLAINSQDNKIDSTQMYRGGFWSNLGYRFKNDSSNMSFSTIVLARYLYYNEINYLKRDKNHLIGQMNLIDLGIKLELEILNRLTIGAESIVRFALSNDIFESTYKLNGLVQYNLGKNRLIYASIGNNYNDYTDSKPEDLIFTFGINIGFGDNIDLFVSGLNKSH